MKHMSLSKYKKYLREMVRDFDALPLRDVKKPKVGVVGEILVKYHPNANNDIVKLIEDEGGEAGNSNWESLRWGCSPDLQVPVANSHCRHRGSQAQPYAQEGGRPTVGVHGMLHRNRGHVRACDGCRNVGPHEGGFAGGESGGAG
jgi:hypothetical protein